MRSLERCNSIIFVGKIKVLRLRFMRGCIFFAFEVIKNGLNGGFFIKKCQICNMNEVFQNLLSQISTLEIIVKGVLIGLVASAPMGPVGVLCVQRTLNKGRVYGLVTGTGAAFSDIIYALITGIDTGVKVHIKQHHIRRFLLQSRNQ